MSRLERNNKVFSWTKKAKSATENFRKQYWRRKIAYQLPFKEFAFSTLSKDVSRLAVGICIDWWRSSSLKKKVWNSPVITLMMILNAYFTCYFQSRRNFLDNFRVFVVCSHMQSKDSVPSSNIHRKDAQKTDPHKYKDKYTPMEKYS